MKKISNRKRNVIGFVVALFVIGYFSKEYYFEKILRENLAVEFKSSEVSILGRSIALNLVTYENQGEKITDTYSADKFKAKIESVNFKTKEVVVEKMIIDGFSFKREEKIPGYGTLPEVNVIEQVLPVAKETQDSKIEVATANPVVQEPAPSKSKVKEKSSKNPFKRFLKTVEKTLGEGTTKVTDLIDEKWLQNNIDKFISDYLRERLIENSINGDEFLKKVTTRIEKENLDKELWSIHVKELEVSANVFGEEVKGTVLNLKNKVSEMTEPVILDFSNENGTNDIKGTIFVPTLSGEIALNFQNFNYKAVPQLERYLKEAHVGIVQKTFYNEGNATIKGVVIVKNAKLNVNLILDEFIKSEKLSKSDARVKALGFALKRIESGKLEYIFNSQTGELQIRTDIVAQIKKIITENFFQVTQEVIQR